MKIIINNAKMIFAGQGREIPLADRLAKVLNTLNKGAFNNFLMDIGGEDGTIWNKIQLLFMPIFSDNGVVYYDIKSESIRGLQNALTPTYWELTNDVNKTSIKGYKGKAVAEDDTYVSVNLSTYGIDVTTSNGCLFGIYPNNPNPSSSLIETSLKDLSLQNTIKNIILKNRETEVIYATATKTASDFATTLIACTYSSGGKTGICSNLADTVESNTVQGTTETLFCPCGRSYGYSNSYGALFSVQGLAKGLTANEAEIIKNALVRMYNSL